MSGYGREECQLESFDSTQQEVTWLGECRIGLVGLRGKPTRLRFYVQKASLYGFQIR